MNIIKKKCVSTIIGGISGNVTYNGKTINIPRGSALCGTPPTGVLGQAGGGCPKTY